MTCLPLPKNGASRFFLILSLIVSVFTFTGYTGHASPAGSRADQTELLARNRPKDRKAVSFQTALAGMAPAEPLISRREGGFYTLSLLHNKLIVNKIIYLEQKYAAFRQPAGYLTVQMILCAEDEDFVHAS